MNYYPDTYLYGTDQPGWENFNVEISLNTYWFYDFFEALQFASMFNSWPVESKGGSKWYK